MGAAGMFFLLQPCPPPAKVVIIAAARYKSRMGNPYSKPLATCLQTQDLLSAPTPNLLQILSSAKQLGADSPKPPPEPEEVTAMLALPSMQVRG